LPNFAAGSITGFEKETKGLVAILEKGKKVESMVETTHGCNVSDPLVAGNVIALSLNVDSTIKGKERSTMSEMCVYKVKDGKIITEEFFMQLTLQ